MIPVKELSGKVMATDPALKPASDGDQRVLESLLPSVAHHWSLRQTVYRQVKLLERHFQQDKMVSAQKELAVLLGKPEKSVPRRNPGAGRAARAQAQDVVKTLKQLSDQAITPRFLVQSNNLPRIAPLLGELNIGDEVWPPGSRRWRNPTGEKSRRGRPDGGLQAGQGSQPRKNRSCGAGKSKGGDYCSIFS